MTVDVCIFTDMYFSSVPNYITNKYYGVVTEILAFICSCCLKWRKFHHLTLSFTDK